VRCTKAEQTSTQRASAPALSSTDSLNRHEHNGDDMLVRIRPD
jgi:hypothetical protein